MNLSSAIQLVYRGLKSNDQTYPVEHVESAIRLLGEMFLRETNIVRSSGSVSTVASTATLNIATTITDFRAERMVQVHQTTSYEPLKVWEYDTVRREQENNTATGEPEALGWQTDTTALLWPTPDAVYAMTVIYRPPLISTTGVNPTLNVPDEYCYELFYFGASAAVEHNDPASRYQAVGWQRAMDLIGRASRNTAFSAPWSAPSPM